MCNCCFKTVVPDTANLDAHKRVRYFTGLVLGPDELKQDQHYMMERDRLHQRSLHGYGTVLGLGISIDDSAGTPKIVVRAGMAVTPRGETVCVPLDQCAELNDFLQANAEDLGLATSGSPAVPLASPPDFLTLWLVLCPRDCETDKVRALGDPCRTPEDAMEPSRIADDFELKLVTQQPEHIEEQAIRIMGALMSAVEITDTPSSGVFFTAEEMAELVGRLVPTGSPGVLPTIDEVMAGSPALVAPGSPGIGPISIHPDEVSEVMSAAWRVWITEVRPHLAGGAAGCADRGENCVLLARLDFAVADMGSGPEVSGPVDMDETERPWLVQTRLLQEVW